MSWVEMTAAADLMEVTRRQARQFADHGGAGLRHRALSYDSKRIVLDETPLTAGLVGKYVETYEYPDGRLEVRWKASRCLIACSPRSSA